MHVRRGALGWGVFLILAGAIPLAVRAGIMSEAQVNDLWQLWPMILIGLGVGLLLGRSRFAFIGGLIVAATFAVLYHLGVMQIVVRAFAVIMSRLMGPGARVSRPVRSPRALRVRCRRSRAPAPERLRYRRAASAPVHRRG